MGHVHDDGMRMKLRRRIAIHRSAGIVLKRRRNKLTGRLWLMNATDASLRVVLEHAKSHRHRFTMRHSHTVIAANQRHERDALRRPEHRIPTGPMQNRIDLLPHLVGVRA